MKGDECAWCPNWDTEPRQVGYEFTDAGRARPRFLDLCWPCWDAAETERAEGRRG